MERGTGIEPVSLAWKARAQPLYQPRVKYMMQTRNFIAANGSVQIHLSVNDTGSVCYIFVNDIYNERLTMRYFTSMEDALQFIENMWLVPRTRIELVISGYQPLVIPFNYPGTINRI